jgi:hypothetical protein
MRFSVVAIVAAIVAVASAQELNPLYPFKPDGPCIQKCLTVSLENNSLSCKSPYNPQPTTQAWIHSATTSPGASSRHTHMQLLLYSIIVINDD